VDFAVWGVMSQLVGLDEPGDRWCVHAGKMCSFVWAGGCHLCVLSGSAITHHKQRRVLLHDVLRPRADAGTWCPRSCMWQGEGHMSWDMLKVHLHQQTAPNKPCPVREKHI
jgi:hypothetical protein